jgi:uncharacterized protein DUF3592
MEDASTPSRPRLWAAAGVAAPMILAVVLAIGLARRAEASDPVRNGVDTQATIVAHSGERATVRFATAAGATTLTSVAVCHHQSYDVGNPLLVRYNPKNPMQAAERDMLPMPNFKLPAVVLLLGFVGTVALAARLRQSLIPPTTPHPPAVPEGPWSGPEWAAPQDSAEELVVATADV